MSEQPTVFLPPLSDAFDRGPGLPAWTLRLMPLPAGGVEVAIDGRTLGVIPTVAGPNADGFAEAIVGYYDLLDGWEAWVEWETDDGDLMEFMRDEDGSLPEGFDPARQTGSEIRLYEPLPPEVQAQVALSKARGSNPLTPGRACISIYLRADGTVTSAHATQTIRPGVSTPSD